MLLLQPPLNTFHAALQQLGCCFGFDEDQASKGKASGFGQAASLPPGLEAETHMLAKFGFNVCKAALAGSGPHCNSFVELRGILWKAVLPGGKPHKRALSTSIDPDNHPPSCYAAFHDTSALYVHLRILP